MAKNGCVEHKYIGEYSAFGDTRAEALRKLKNLLNEDLISIYFDHSEPYCEEMTNFYVLEENGKSHYLSVYKIQDAYFADLDS